MLLWGYSIMRNLENTAPEGVTDIQPVNLVAVPFGPHLQLARNRGHQASHQQVTYLIQYTYLDDIQTLY